MESLAAFEAELQDRSKRSADDGLGNRQSPVTHAGKTMDDDFPEVLPDDSLSVVSDDDDDDDDNSNGTVMTGAAWTQRAVQVFATPQDFRKSVKTWSAKVYPTPALNSSDSDKWHKFDAEPDSLSRELLHPPQAPEIRIDPSVLQEGPNTRRATQTAESARLKHSILAQTMNLQNDKEKPVVAQAEAGYPSDAAVQTPKQPSLLTVQPVDAGKPGFPANNSPKDKFASPLVTSAPDAESVTGQPAAATAFPSTSPISIRIVMGRDDHIDQVRDIYNEEFFKGAQAPGQQPATSQDIRRLYLASLQFKLPFLVAISSEQGGEHVLGVGFLQPRPLIGIVEPQDLYCAECSVFVRPKYRNRGIGQEMLQCLLSIVTSHLGSSQSKTLADGTEEKNKKKKLNDNTGTDQISGLSYKFVRKIETSGPKALPPLIHYIIVDVVCGNVDGLAEKKYADVLTQKFDFKLGNPLDTVVWTKDGPVAVKKIMFYRTCEHFVPRSEMLAPAATPVLAGGPVQQPAVHPVSQAVGQAKAAVPTRDTSPTRDNARSLPGRLLYDLMLAPATTGGNNTYIGGRALANKPTTATDFW